MMQGRDGGKDEVENRKTTGVQRFTYTPGFETNIQKSEDASIHLVQIGWIVNYKRGRPVRFFIFCVLEQVFQILASCYLF